MTTHYLVSVGTSLISNYNKWEDRTVEDIGTDDESWDSFEAGDYVPALKNYLDRTAPREASAELSSLLKDATKAPKPGDTVWLVHTTTRPAEACARCIEEALKKEASSLEVQYRPVQGLGEASQGGFAERGLPNLIRDLVELVGEALEGEHRCVLVPTGGYKAIIPYFVAVAMLYQLDCIYVYEDSDEVLTLPPLPLHVDLSRWTTLESVVESLEGKSREEAKKSRLYEELKGRLQILMVEEDGGAFKASGLCKALRDRALDDRRRPELQFRTRNSPLLHYLVGEDGDKSLRGKFLRLAEIGPHVWKGDQVPEMADHALLHHADLFHLAERVLLPAFYLHEIRGKGPFLSPEELFVLLGALHLHDCGHVLGRVDREDGNPHRLLPTEVRDHHHVLGYLRLTEPDKHGETGGHIHQALREKKEKPSDDVPWTPSDLENALRAIALAGLYHRKKMRLREPRSYPFLEGTSLPEVPCLGEFLESLVKNDDLVMVGDVKLTEDRLVLLVSLLRIIDSLDEQGARTGGREAADFHLKLLDTQRKQEEELAKGPRDALEAMGTSGEGTPADRLKRLDDLIEDYTADFFGKEKKSDAGKPLRGPAPPFWETFEGLYPDPVRPVALEYAVSSIRSRFKMSQKDHYAEKLHVEGVEIAHSFRDDTVCFDIDLRMEPDFILRKEGRRQRQDLLRSMRKEYENPEIVDGREVPVVKEALEKAGIVLHYAVEEEA